MPSRYDPADPLADLIENAERIAGYLGGMGREAFAANGLVEMLLSAVLSAFARPRTAWAIEHIT